MFNPLDQATEFVSERDPDWKASHMYSLGDINHINGCYQDEVNGCYWVKTIDGRFQRFNDPQISTLITMKAPPRPIEMSRNTTATVRTKLDPEWKLLGKLPRYNMKLMRTKLPRYKDEINGCFWVTQIDGGYMRVEFPITNPDNIELENVETEGKKPTTKRKASKKPTTKWKSGCRPDCMKKASALDCCFLCSFKGAKYRERPGSACCLFGLFSWFEYWNGDDWSDSDSFCYFALCGIPVCGCCGLQACNCICYLMTCGMFCTNGNPKKKEQDRSPVHALVRLLLSPCLCGGQRGTDREDECVPLLYNSHGVEEDQMDIHCHRCDHAQRYVEYFSDKVDSNHECFLD